MAEHDLEDPWLLEAAEPASDLEQFDDDVEQAPDENRDAKEVGLQPSATWLGKVRGFHPGFFGFERAYNRYFYTLLISMRYFESIRDDERLGRVLLALLQGERPWMLNLVWQYWKTSLHDRFSEVLMVLYRFLLRHKDLVSEDDLRRFLRKAEQYQPHEDKKVRLRELGATLLAHQGRVADAYDMLPQPAALVSTALKNPKTHRHDKMLGLLRKKQLYNLLRSNEDGASWDPLRHDPEQWGKAGRNGRQLAVESKMHLRRALQKDPEDTMLYIHMIEIFLNEGDLAGAREVASTMIEADDKTKNLDFDANAYYLMFLLRDLDEQMGSNSNLAVQSCLEQAFACCFRMLRMDPKSVPTLRVVINLCDAFEEFAMDFQEDVLESLVLSVGVVLPIPVDHDDLSPDRTVQIRALVIIEKILHEFSIHYLESFEREGTRPGSIGAKNPCVNALMLISSQRYWHPTMFQIPCTEEGHARLAVLYIVWRLQRDRKLFWACMSDPSRLSTILHETLPADGRAKAQMLWIETRLQLYIKILQRI
mmetsp:Transcript_9290/g.18457  ORF Transcript_9290/g.18457 Transcript_9290/m.18457 type:complete len:536 (+) Transcript_9290:70-1677(+)